MPGTIATANVIKGTKVAPGDVLVTTEAHEMETWVRTDRDCVAAAVVARPGAAVDSKDLPIVLT
jgi:pyruvate carboxylase